MVARREISFPAGRKDLAGLSVGDQVLISGRIVTGRDRIHQYLFNERPDTASIPFPLEDGLLYHCGPIVKKGGDGYTMVACGPTTSARMEMYEWWVIGNYGLGAVMGKGGMGERTLAALARSGGVYLHTIGGAAVYLAQRVRRVIDVWKIEEFGAPEAMWLLDVEEFPAIVTMDSKGGSLHESVRKESERAYRKILGIRDEHR